MAATFAVTGLRKNNFGNCKANTGTITITGTPTSNGDAITAAVFGLSNIRRLEFSASIDSTTTPANALLPYYNPVSGKLIAYGVKTTGTDGQPFQQSAGSETGYTLQFTAIGR